MIKQLKPTIFLCLLALIITTSSCIKYKTKYSCDSYCVPIKISLKVDNKSIEPILAGTAYEIVLLEKFSGSTQNNRIMSSGKADANGNFTTTVECDTSLLNNDNYYIKINYTWDVNNIKVCYSTSKGFTIDNYPPGGEYVLNVESYKKVNTSLNFVKKSTDSLKSAFFYITRDCYNSTSYQLNKSQNQTQQVNALSTLNGMNYITITTTDNLNVNHYQQDSFYVDQQFAGKTFEY